MKFAVLLFCLACGLGFGCGGCCLLCLGSYGALFCGALVDVGGLLFGGLWTFVGLIALRWYVGTVDYLVGCLWLY